MHPAPSVIVFTTLSGLGFGLLAFLGFGFPAPVGWAAFFHYGLGFVLAVGGLLSSTFHLGHPERALKAFSQWQSSWLSREGWAAVIALGLTGLTGLLALFGARIGLLGWLGGLACLGTIFTTSMIYAQLKTVPRWNHWTTPAIFLTFSMAGGALLAGQTQVALGFMVMAFGLQLIRHALTDRAFETSDTSLASATGLGSRGAVRSFEKPHTGPNYLTKEMVFQIGRKHAAKLRIIALALAFGVPVLLLLLAAMNVTGLTAALLVLASLCHTAGALGLRWLFFAEAEHVVGHYYGRMSQ